MTHLNKKLLVALFDLAQGDVPATVQRLATHLDLPRRDVACGLDELARLGLVRAETVRLTFLGVMRAAGLRARVEATSRAA